MPAATPPKPPVITQDNVEVTRQEPVINLEAKGQPSNPERSPLEELMGPDVLNKLIEARIKQYMDESGVTRSSADKMVPVNGPVQATPTFNYLGHYRNDVSPELEVQELNMDAEVPQLEPIPGSFIRFRRSHFFATTENQVKQLDWMMGVAEHSADTRDSLGGNRAIYKDDGEKIFYCTAGCSRADFHSASEQRYKAHMRGVHGVEL